ncbi:DUF4168 domain-containing protein [Rhizobium sp. CC-YZS058]|uniref:DUF4168 domain-containing protein n=1 Tax=Rhizobium sp. CC-YZS058 TaxID=3042153 RepID=UPI002B0554C3|nr:DUF4168 domain-containing protein [Rhizobium sp. CC-YZS058]MEA3534178.1 DUF4168 domain-containing protein [Rhizobium sp. CC-YZS058]
MTLRPTRRRSAVFAALLLTPLAGQAFAQGAAIPERSAPAAPAQPSSKLSDEKLKAFAVAYLKVDRVRQDYSARIGQTQDQGARQTLKNEANKKMIEAVETAPDMSLEEYKTIITAAQADPAVAQKVQNNLRGAAPAAQ